MSRWFPGEEDTYEATDQFWSKSVSIYRWPNAKKGKIVFQLKTKPFAAQCIIQWSYNLVWKAVFTLEMHGWPPSTQWSDIWSRWPWLVIWSCLVLSVQNNFWAEKVYTFTGRIPFMHFFNMVNRVTLYSLSKDFFFYFVSNLEFPGKICRKIRFHNQARCTQRKPNPNPKVINSGEICFICVSKR